MHLPDIDAALLVLNRAYPHQMGPARDGARTRPFLHAGGALAADVVAPFAASLHGPGDNVSISCPGMLSYLAMIPYGLPS